MDKKQEFDLGIELTEGEQISNETLEELSNGRGDDEDE